MIFLLKLGIRRSLKIKAMEGKMKKKIAMVKIPITMNLRRKRSNPMR